MIIVDDCCHVKNLYEQVFSGDVCLKLDIFHACSRVISTLSKTETFFNTFSKEFSVIFREDGDLGEERLENTPSPEDIEANLERLLFCWSDRLPSATLTAIDSLRNHIRKGCLSNIPPGCGTERNERLHRHLNRSLLCGVSKLGPELAIAVLSTAFYAWNCKRKGLNFINKRTVPIMPIELESALSCCSNQQPESTHMKAKSDSASGSKPSSSLMDVTTVNPDPAKTATNVTDLLTEAMVDYTIERAMQIQEFLTSFRGRCSNKTVDIMSLSMGRCSLIRLFVEDESKREEMRFDSSGLHLENLQRNLSGFNLEIDHTAGDGDCFFRSTVKQLHKLLKVCPQIQAHISSLGLGEVEDQDTARLRKLFVGEMKENLDEYKDWIIGSNLQEEIEQFLQ